MLLNEIITAPRFRGGLHVWLDEDKMVKIIGLPQTMTDEQFIELVYATHEDKKRTPQNINDNLPADIKQWRMRDREANWKTEKETIRDWFEHRLNYPTEPIVVSDKQLDEYPWARRELTQAKPTTLQSYISHIIDIENQLGFRGGRD